MDVALALWGGIIGAIMMTAVYAGLMALKVTRFDLIAFQGGLLTRERGMIYIVGAVLQVTLGALVALLYRLLFLQLDAASYVGWGMLAGFAQGLLVALALPLIAAANQQVRQGEVHPPGFLGRRYGGATPLALVVAFAVYGVWVGLFLLG